MALFDDAGSVLAPARSAAAVAPHDTNDLATVTRALYVGGAGDLSVIFADDATPVTLVAVPAGSLLPIRVKRVRVTGTTETNLVALS